MTTPTSDALDQPPGAVRRMRLRLDGPARSRREPLRNPNTRQMYQHPQTKLGIEAWRLRWQAAGSPRIYGPVVVLIVVEAERPDSHLLTRGDELSAAGKRHPIPSKPDLDNVSKLVLDALKGHAFDDDVHVATLGVSKVYGVRDRTVCDIAAWTPELGSLIMAGWLLALRGTPGRARITEAES